jgi:hypothetical protein
MAKYVLVPGFPPLMYDEKSPEYAILKALPKERKPELLSATDAKVVAAYARYLAPKAQ